MEALPILTCYFEIYLDDRLYLRISHSLDAKLLFRFCLDLSFLPARIELRWIFISYMTTCYMWYNVYLISALAICDTMYILFQHLQYVIQCISYFSTCYMWYNVYLISALTICDTMYILFQHLLYVIQCISYFSTYYMWYNVYLISALTSCFDPRWHIRIPSVSILFVTMVILVSTSRIVLEIWRVVKPANIGWRLLDMTSKGGAVDLSFKSA